jgi:hypothetical protein
LISLKTGVKRRRELSNSGGLNGFHSAGACVEKEQENGTHSFVGIRGQHFHETIGFFRTQKVLPEIVQGQQGYAA